MRLIVKSPVWDDLREIALRISEDNPEAGERFLEVAEEAFALLVRHPAIGRPRSFSVPGIRSWVLPRFQNYLVFYVPTKTELQVLAVLHGARDLPNVLTQRLE